MNRIIVITALVVILGLLSGCGQISGNNTSVPALEPSNSEELGGNVGPSDSAGAWFQTGSEAVWPEAIPEDIPPLEEEIDTVMAGTGRVRIFYHNVSDEQLQSYLALLEREGFNLEYLVYTEEGQPDHSEEKLKKGDYDAVNITRGNYRMRIEYGAGDVTYDIEGVAIGSLVGWPEELLGRLSQPEECEISTVFPMQDGSISIECKSATENILEQYVEQLKGMGYAVVHENFNQNHEWIDVSLSDGDTTVKARTYGSDILGLQVWLTSSDQLEGVVLPEDKNDKWSESVPANVPAFTEGKLISALGSNPTLFIYEVTDEGALERYMQQLVNAGFEETNRFDNMEGALINATFSDGKTNIQLMPMSEGQIGIKIKPE